MAPRKFSLGCEVQDCGFRTPIVGEEHFAALVKLLQIHSMSVHDLPVGETPSNPATLHVPRDRRQELGTGWEEAGPAGSIALPPRAVQDKEGAAAGSRNVVASISLPQVCLLSILRVEPYSEEFTF